MAHSNALTPDRTPSMHGCKSNLSCCQCWPFRRCSRDASTDVSQNGTLQRLQHGSASTRIRDMNRSDIPCGQMLVLRQRLDTGRRWHVAVDARTQRGALPQARSLMLRILLRTPGHLWMFARVEQRGARIWWWILFAQRGKGVGVVFHHIRSAEGRTRLPHRLVHSRAILASTASSVNRCSRSHRLT